MLTTCYCWAKMRVNWTKQWAIYSRCSQSKDPVSSVGTSVWISKGDWIYFFSLNRNMLIPSRQRTKWHKPIAYSRQCRRHFTTTRTSTPTTRRSTMSSKAASSARYCTWARARAPTQLLQLAHSPIRCWMYHFPVSCCHLISFLHLSYPHLWA